MGSSLARSWRISGEWVGGHGEQISCVAGPVILYKDEQEDTADKGHWSQDDHPRFEGTATILWRFLLHSLCICILVVLLVVQHRDSGE